MSSSVSGPGGLSRSGMGSYIFGLSQSVLKPSLSASDAAASIEELLGLPGGEVEYTLSCWKMPISLAVFEATDPCLVLVGVCPADF